MIKWRYASDIYKVIAALRQENYLIAAMEQTPDSELLPEFTPPDKLAIIVGREVEGLEEEIIKLCDLTLEIPMLGKKESFNVVQAAAMALYHCRFHR